MLIVGAAFMEIVPAGAALIGAISMLIVGAAFMEIVPAGAALIGAMSIDIVVSEVVDTAATTGNTTTTGEELAGGIPLINQHEGAPFTYCQLLGA